MESRAFPRTYGGEIWLDFCWSCQGIWFDAHESIQLAPGGIVALFQEIHKNHELAQPLAEMLQCPRCAKRLAYAQDMSKSGHFAYYQCSAAHGRFTAFNQFLIEKGFVRVLSNVEIASLAAQIQTIRCNGCGAPIDLQRDTACNHCRSPIAILDVQAVEKALAAYAEAGKAKPLREHDVIAELILQRERDRLEQLQAGRADKQQHAVDLIGSSIRLFVRFLE